MKIKNLFISDYEEISKKQYKKYIKYKKKELEEGELIYSFERESSQMNLLYYEDNFEEKQLINSIEYLNGNLILDINLETYVINFKKRKGHLEIIIKAFGELLEIIQLEERKNYFNNFSTNNGILSFF